MDRYVSEEPADTLNRFYPSKLLPWSLLCWALLAPAAYAQTVSGVVRDSVSRRPLAGALVELRRDNARHAAHSDEEGGFNLGSVPAGTYRLSVRRLGFAERTGQFQVTKDDVAMDVTLVSIARDLDTMYVRAGVTGIYGVVGSSEGLRPLAGAKVVVLGANRNKITDSTGSFFVPLAKPGMYMVRITRAGYEPRFFPLAVTAGGAVEASRLLDSATTSTPGHEVLWQDFDQRLRWRAMNSALVTGAELRRAGSTLMEAIEGSGSYVSRGLFIGNSICVFLNGTPRPGMTLNVIPTEKIEVVELYGEKDEGARNLASKWPHMAHCGEMMRIQRYEKLDGPRARATAHWAVVWLKP